MTASKNTIRPLMPLFPPKGHVPFAIQYTLDNSLGPNQYEEFWFDSRFHIIKPTDFADMDEFIKHRYQKGIIYGPRDLEITYPEGLTVIGVSTTEQFRPGEDNDGSPLSNQDSDDDGIPDDLDEDPDDPNVPYPDLDEDGIHVNPDDPDNSDPDDDNPDDPYPDEDQDGYRSNVDPNDSDPDIVPDPEPVVELKIQAEYVILAPEPTIFEGELASSAGPGMNATVVQVVPMIGTQQLYIEIGAYKSTGANNSSPLEMRGHMRFAIGSFTSDSIPWDATEEEMQDVIKNMAEFANSDVQVTGTMQEIIDEDIVFIEVTISPPINHRIMLWGVNDVDTPELSMVPNTENGGVPSSPYRYAFKCRTKYEEFIDSDVTFQCFNASQLNGVEVGTRVMCRKINGIWNIIYP